MEMLPTYLAPGQRYIRTSHGWSTNAAVTILRVGPDASGLVWVIYGAPDGEESARPASRFEAAIAAGEIIPIVAAGTVGRC
jgi:hypothetical protein